jgi:hypothetical protein
MQAWGFFLWSAVCEEVEWTHQCWDLWRLLT